MKKTLIFISSLILILILGIGYSKTRLSNQPPASPQATIKNPDFQPRVEVVASDLNVPWSILFTSESRMLVTERPGRIRIIENGKLDQEPLITLPEVSAEGEAGLMGLTLDPNYAENNYLYASYAYSQSGNLFVKVIRLIDEGSQARIDKTIIDNIPAAQNHAGSRIKFGPDGKLYISTGDASNKNLAQDLNSLAGKILRINGDGSIPEDNPFPNSPVYTYGHRNPQGFDWHPGTNQLYATEHGPSGFDGPPGGDEINLIKKGANYGWPLVSHQNKREGLENPLKVYTPAIAPAGASFYWGTQIPSFKNSFLFAMLKGEGIIKLVFDTNSQIMEEEKLEIGNIGRIREITVGPDGFIYFTTSNRDGRGEIRYNDDKVLRLTNP